MIRVLFVCTGNAARSQMAEALLRALGRDGVDAHSAGTDPKGLHPLTVRVLDEIGIDARGQASKHLDRYRDQPWDYVITVCDAAAEACPVFPGGRHRLHWSFPDPAAVPGPEGTRLAAFRAVRDAISERVQAFLAEVAQSAGR